MLDRKSTCVLCYKKYIEDSRINQYRFPFWKDYIDACDHCDEYGRDPLPWCELGLK